MKLLLGFLLAFTSYTAGATSFDEVWKSFYRNSLGKKSMSDEREANQLSLERGERHWLPRIYVSGQWFRTNDPGQVFFNQLGQRAVTQADFTPSTLNQPGQQTFKAGTIGLDFALYEGGFKSAQVSHFEKLVRASELEEKAKESEEYSELARRYGGVLLLDQSSEDLRGLRKNLQQVIAKYQVGEESNPVGHSGLLGLQGALNRIEGLLNEFELRSNRDKKWIAEKTKIGDSWAPETNLSLEDYLISTLAPNPGAGASSMILTQEKKLEAFSEMQRMERSRYLPKIGLFAQNNLYQGSRDTASSQSLGLYVMWEMFNPDSYGREGEAAARVIAQETKLRAYKQDEKIALGELSDSSIAMEKTLNILRDSEIILGKQSILSMKLFRSGMLNALQLAEVINRRVDLIENIFKARTSYLDVKSRLYQIQH